MVAENENADSNVTGDNAASNQSGGFEQPGASVAKEAPSAAQASEAPTEAAQPGVAPSPTTAEGSSRSPDDSSAAPPADSAPPPVEDKLKKGAKGYLMKVGKLMIMLAILGSLILGFAAYMISNTLNGIVNKLEHPLE